MKNLSFPKTVIFPFSFFIALLLLAGCSDNSTVTDPPNGDPPDEPQTVQPVVLAEIPHDSDAYTQGLFVNDSLMYESTGLYGRSSVRILDVASGDLLRIRDVDSRFFGEGLVLFNDQLVQLTWQSNTAFIYNPQTLEPRGTFQYDGPGWGLTSDSIHFIMSNGTNTIVFRNDQFTIVREINVTRDGQFVNSLNELEYAHGKIYANIFRRDIIVEINPANGAVTKVIDCSAIVAAENPARSDAVLNGIAYLPDRDTFYITGKLWSKIYEVRIP